MTTEEGEAPEGLRNVAMPEVLVRVEPGPCDDWVLCDANGHWITNGYNKRPLEFIARSLNGYPKALELLKDFYKAVRRPGAPHPEVCCCDLCETARELLAEEE